MITYAYGRRSMLHVSNTFSIISFVSCFVRLPMMRPTSTCQWFKYESPPVSLHRPIHNYETILCNFTYAPVPIQQWICTDVLCYSYWEYRYIKEWFSNELYQTLFWIQYLKFSTRIAIKCLGIFFPSVLSLSLCCLAHQHSHGNPAVSWVSIYNVNIWKLTNLLCCHYHRNTIVDNWLSQTQGTNKSARSFLHLKALKNILNRFMQSPIKIFKFCLHHAIKTGKQCINNFLNNTWHPLFELFTFVL